MTEELMHTFARIAHKATVEIRPEVSGDSEYWRIRSAIQNAIAASDPPVMAVPDAKPNAIVIEPIVGAVVVEGHRYVVLQANSLGLDLYCDDSFVATYPILSDMPEIIRKHSNASR